MNSDSGLQWGLHLHSTLAPPPPGARWAVQASGGLHISLLMKINASTLCLKGPDTVPACGFPNRFLPRKGGFIQHNFLFEVFSSMQLILVIYAAVKQLLFCFTALSSCSCQCNESVILWKQVSGRSETLNPWIKIILRSLYATYQQCAITAFVCLLFLIIAPTRTTHPFRKGKGEANNCSHFIAPEVKASLPSLTSCPLPPIFHDWPVCFVSIFIFSSSNALGVCHPEVLICTFTPAHLFGKGDKLPPTYAYLKSFLHFPNTGRCSTHAPCGCC